MALSVGELDKEAYQKLYDAGRSVVGVGECGRGGGDLLQVGCFNCVA